jgi:VanZ family protein
MLPLRYAWRWRLAGGLILLVILAAAVAPAIFPWLAGGGTSLPNVDKWMHGLAFAMLALWFTGQYARSSYVRIAIMLLTYGLLIEVVQSFVPYRSAEFADLAADAAGIGIGLLIAALATGGWSIRAEAWLDKTFA